MKLCGSKCLIVFQNLTSSCVKRNLITSCTSASWIIEIIKFFKQAFPPVLLALCFELCVYGTYWCWMNIHVMLYMVEVVCSYFSFNVQTEPIKMCFVELTCMFQSTCICILVSQSICFTFWVALSRLQKKLRQASLTVKHRMESRDRKELFQQTPTSHEKIRYHVLTLLCKYVSILKNLISNLVTFVDAKTNSCLKKKLL